MRATLVAAVVVLIVGNLAWAQATRQAAAPPRTPVPLTADENAELAKAAEQLGAEIDALREKHKGRPDLLARLPDVQIYHNALRYPVQYGDACEIKKARKALADGLERARQLADGKAPWVTQSGPRGYVSKIDGSVQPYIVGVPKEYKTGETKLYWRLDFFCHGRDEGLTELKFLSQNAPAADDHFVVHPYGRYCNANKFAGEVDVLEVLADLKRRYLIDDNRIVMTGFSMGGASAWQFATHFPGVWVAASPGAGFSETMEFSRLRPGQVPPYEEKLFHLYDATDYAVNLFNCPTVAYAGELDGQIQASDMMIKAMEKEGLKLERMLGPGTKHEYHKETKKALDERLGQLARLGRPTAPKKVRFTTWTLKYNKSYWVTVDALGKHWERARVEAEHTPVGIKALTENVEGLTFSFPIGRNPLKPDDRPVLSVDGVKIEGPPLGDEPWSARLVKVNGKWQLAGGAPDDGLRKRHGLQGPIDDAFMDSFLIVLPSGKPTNEKVATWVEKESADAILQWRRQFRGEARVKKDVEVTDQDIQENNLVLWGDPKSNQLLARMTGKLPATWTADGFKLAGKSYDPAHHVPVLIYPNPLNPARYVVLNSGFTFRQWPVSNARQTPKLPDYAVLDIDGRGTADTPGGDVVNAGFFDERWQAPAGAAAGR